MGTKTTLIDLNEYLFQTLDVLTNSDLQGKDLDNEIKRAHAVNMTAACIIKNASAMIGAAKLQAECTGQQTQIPAGLIGTAEIVEA